MVSYYQTLGAESPDAYRFNSCTTTFEMVNENTFAEVLCPNTIFDIIDFHVRECVRREIKFRVCKNCGKYFAVTGHAGIEHCDLVINKKVRLVRKLARFVFGKRVGAVIRCSGFTVGSIRGDLLGSRQGGSSQMLSMPGVREPEKRKQTVRQAKFPLKNLWDGSATHKSISQGETTISPACVSLFTVKKILITINGVNRLK